MGDRGSYHYDKRAKRWYVHIYWNGKHNKIWKYPGVDLKLSSEDMADELLKMIRGELRHGTFLLKTYLPDSPLSIKEYSDRWLKLADICDNTRRVYSSDINVCVQYFKGNKDIRKIGKADLIEFKKHLATVRTTKGVYNALNTLKTMLRFAYDNDDLKRVPPFPKLSQGQIGKVKFLTIEQQEKVLIELGAHRNVFEFGMIYGLRVQEVCALMKDSITSTEIIIQRAFSNGKIQGTKTGQSRRYNITRSARKCLDNVQPHFSQFVFSRDGRKPYSGKILNRLWKDACGKTDICLPLQAALRHSLGCQLLEEGHSLELVAKALGHSSTAVTRRYAQRTNEAVNNALENRGKVIQLPDKKKEEGNGS
ncbi:MAG: tyrosine-type recombinase/integrase [Methanoregula sp.]|jgi:integrase